MAGQLLLKLRRERLMAEVYAALCREYPENVMLCRFRDELKLRAKRTRHLAMRGLPLLSGGPVDAAA